MMDPRPERFSATKKLHEHVSAALLNAGFTVRQTPWTTYMLGQRLTGLLSESFGTLTLPYEINTLTPKRQLNLAEVRQIGQMIVSGSADYFSGQDGKSCLSLVDQIRLNRVKAANALAGNPKIDDPIQAEAKVAEYRQESARVNGGGPSSLPVTESKTVHEHL